MRIAIAQLNYTIGDFVNNRSKIHQSIQSAIHNKAELILFSELAIGGYFAKDLWIKNEFIAQCQYEIELLLPLSEKIAIVIGSVTPNTESGNPLYNSAYFIFNQKIQNITHKTLLPNYDIFQESRYFEAAKSWSVVQFKGVTFGVTICEDIWHTNTPNLYKQSPIEKLLEQKAQVILNLSASPFHYYHEEERLQVLKRITQEHKVPVVYCNQVGAHTDIIFDGGSMVLDGFGNVRLSLPQFEECINYIDLPLEEADIVEHELEIKAKKHYQANKNIDQIYEALVFGIREYFDKNGFKNAIIASSGGIDSAVVLSLACAALGNEQVKAILLPSQFSTNHSIDDAIELSKNLQNPFEILEIAPVYDSILNLLKDQFKDQAFDVTEENIQSRIRGLITMAMSNKFGYILLNTSNKSEIATGYGTLYGDMAGGLSIIGDLYKTQVYALANYINHKEEIIPKHILIKAPSAELRPGQTDQDSLPDYSILDNILFQYIEENKTIAEINNVMGELSTIKRIINMLHKNEYKRAQFCPILRVSPSAFGSGIKWPVVARYSDL